jgi:FkbM family methyltransferase
MRETVRQRVEEARLIVRAFDAAALYGNASALGRLRLAIRQVLLWSGRGLVFVASAVYQTPHEKACAAWLRDRGDATLRLDYDLDERSVVFDVGGYQGQWASDIFSRYRCTIHIFEPVSAFADAIERRFLMNRSIRVHRCGLAAETRMASIVLAQDGSSILRKGGPSEEVRLVRAIDLIEREGIRAVDLMKINIEGGEYELLEHLIGVDFIRRVRHLQIQFHDCDPGAAERMAKIQQVLSVSHHTTYQYFFVWENWTRNEDRPSDDSAGPRRPT